MILLALGLALAVAGVLLALHLIMTLRVEQAELHRRGEATQQLHWQLDRRVLELQQERARQLQLTVGPELLEALRDLRAVQVTVTHQLSPDPVQQKMLRRLVRLGVNGGIGRLDPTPSVIPTPEDTAQRQAYDEAVAFGAEQLLADAQAAGFPLTNDEAMAQARQFVEQAYGPAGGGAASPLRELFTAHLGGSRP